MSRHPHELAPLAAVFLAGCALFGSEEEEPPALPDERHLDVVDDQGPFDPSEAVDDDADADDGARAPEPQREGEADAEGGEASAGDEPAEDLRSGSEEDVASPERVRAIEAEREAAQERTNEVAEKRNADDEDLKRRDAANPRPQEEAEPDPPFVTTADLAFDGLLVAVIALAAAGLLRLARRVRRGVWIGVGALVLVGGLALFFVSQSA